MADGESSGLGMVLAVGLGFGAGVLAAVAMEPKTGAVQGSPMPCVMSLSVNAAKAEEAEEQAARGYHELMQAIRDREEQTVLETLARDVAVFEQQARRFRGGPVSAEMLRQRKREVLRSARAQVQRGWR